MLDYYDLQLLIILYFFTLLQLTLRKKCWKDNREKKVKRTRAMTWMTPLRNLDISEHNPKKYLDILKKSVEGDPDSVLKVHTIGNTFENTNL